jgi:hypothetical protein
VSAEGRSRGPPTFFVGMRPPVALGGRRGMAPIRDRTSEAARPRYGVPLRASDSREGGRAGGRERAPVSGALFFYIKALHWSDPGWMRAGEARFLSSLQRLTLRQQPSCRPSDSHPLE